MWGKRAGDAGGVDVAIVVGRELRAELEAIARRAFPLEAVALLACELGAWPEGGPQWIEVVAVRELRNVAESAYCFRVDAAELDAAALALGARARRRFGAFHTHTVTDSTEPSAADVADVVGGGTPYLIYAVASGELAGYLAAGDRRLEPVPVVASPDEIPAKNPCTDPAGDDAPIRP